VTLPYQCERILQKDSLDLTEADREMIYQAIQADPHRHIIITHGTDTMIQTARALQPLTTDRVIVLTGAMLPARFRESDAIFNIGGAIIAAQTLPPGVYIVMNGQVFDPNKIHKNIELNRFEETV
jgi:L-asparaginase